jgi:hypothetical protein
VNVPDDIRTEVMGRLAKVADESGWLALSAAAKSRFYSNWTKDPAIGGRLARYLEPGEVRHYIKDALMKPYCRERRGDPKAVLSLLSIAADTPVRRSFIKPHGCELEDGRVVCWGRANTWKLVLMAVHERSFEGNGATPHAAVLTQAASNFSDDSSRAVVQAAAEKLGITRLVWRLD